MLALGAIFATTDSVAVLQVLDKDRSPILFSLVFGEGVINDAAGVALLRAIQVQTVSDLVTCLKTGPCERFVSKESSGTGVAGPMGIESSEPRKAGGFQIRH